MVYRVMKLAAAMVLATGLSLAAAATALAAAPEVRFGRLTVQGVEIAYREAGDPFSVYALAEQVFVDGALLYDRSDPARQPRNDFTVGILPELEGGR